MLLVPLVVAVPGVQLPGAASLSSALRTYTEATQVCAAVAAQPGSSEGWRRLGKLLHGKGRLEAARAALTQSAALDTGSAQARIDLANVLRSAGCFSEAAAALVAAEEISGHADQSLQYFGAPGAATADGPRTTACPIALPASRPAWPGSSVWVTRLADTAECEWVISTAEEYNAARGGWGNPPPRYAPAGTVADEVRAPHMLVAECPALLEWLNGKLQSAVFPLLAKQYGTAATKGAWLCAQDAFERCQASSMASRTRRRACASHTGR
jgi:tetratricopeptide (TPR) repeat protein